MSPEKIQLVELLLRNKGIDFHQVQSIPRSESESSLLSFEQERAWFLDRQARQNPGCNVSVALRLSGRLSVTALERGLNETIRGHDVLRAHFVSVGGLPVQVISDAAAVSLRLEDLSHLTGSYREDRALQLARLDAGAPFDIAAAPPIRLSLLKLDDELHILLLTFHEIISDGCSIDILVREIAARYQAKSTGQASRPAEASVQYADYALWQRQQQQSDSGASRGHLDGRKLGELVSVSETAAGRARRPGQFRAGARENFRLGESVIADLRNLSRRERVTLATTLLAAFEVLLRHYTEQGDVVVSVSLPNRTRAELREMVGPLTDIFALRSAAPAEASFHKVLRRTKATTLAAYERKDQPLQDMVADPRPEQDSSRGPVFHAMFALVPARPSEIEFADLKAGVAEVHNGAAKCDLSLLIEDREKEMIGALEYDTSLFDAADIRRMAARFQSLLAAIASDAEQTVESLSLKTF